MVASGSSGPESARKALSPRSEFLIGPVMAGDSAIPGLAVNTVGLLMRRSETASGKMPLLHWLANVDAASTLACKRRRGIYIGLQT
jgi:hypothetical protein